MEKNEAKEGGSSVVDILKFALIVAAVVVPFRLFIAQPYIVEGSSMDPTFKDSDYLIVDQTYPRFGAPKRGDVIIMKYPKDTSKFFIKRIIGLPEETVIIKEGRVFIKNSNAENEDSEITLIEDLMKVNYIVVHELLSRSSLI